MRKKLFIFAMPLAMTLLAGCGNGETNFKNLSYKDRLTTAESQRVVGKLIQEVKNFSKITYSVESKTDSNETITKSKSETVVTAYEGNAVHSKTSGSTERKHAGLTEKTTNTIETYNFIAPKTNSAARALMTYTTDKIDGLSFTVDELGDAKYNVYAGFTDDFIDSILEKDYVIYKEGKGYALVVTEENKTVFPQVWGNDTKDSIAIIKTQIVVKINSNYQTTNYFQATSVKTNHDPDTNEFFDKVKEISGTETTGKIEYKARKEKIQKFSEIQTLLRAKHISNVTTVIHTYDEGNTWLATTNVSDDDNIKFNSTTSAEVSSLFCTGFNNAFKKFRIVILVYIYGEVDPVSIPVQINGLKHDGEYNVLDEETREIGLFLNFSVSYGTKATASVEDAVLVENRW